MKLTKISTSLLSLGLLGMGVANAADIDVIATQTTTVQGLNTVLDGNTTWTADNTYILTDRLYVPNGVTLTIEAGTKIYSTSDQNGTPADSSDDTVGALIVARGGQLIASGTANAPIVFDALETLEAERGEDLPYDTDATVGPAPTISTTGLWGGVIVLGNAYTLRTNSSGVNIGDDVIEGFTPASAEDLDADGFSDVLEYGFDAAFPQDDNDNSGVLRYISIRHGGFTFGPDNEINGLTLGGVGRGTTIEFIEVLANDDDGVEFFGGTVNTSNIAVAFVGDDSFDIDQGHSGTHQFWFAVQGPGGDNIGEWDGIGGSIKDLDSIPVAQTAGVDVNGNITGVSPSAPQIFNSTFIGGGATLNDGSEVRLTSRDQGIFTDDSFNGGFFNGIITQSPGFLTNFSSDAAGTDGYGNGLAFGLSLENTVVGDFGSLDDFNAAAVLDDPSTPDEDESLPAVVENRPSNDTRAINNAPANYYVNGFTALPEDGNSAAVTVPGFTTLTRDGSNALTIIDPRLTAGSVALNPATITAGAPQSVTYQGAFDGATNWALGWTALDSFGLFGVTVSSDQDADGLADDFETQIGTNPAVNEGVAVNEAAIEVFFASQQATAVAAATADATAAAEASFITLGGVEADIDVDSGNAIINFELKSSDDLIDFGTQIEAFTVPLTPGARFFRFEPAN